MAAMILAAGLGERLRPITDTTPKALVEVGGISMLSQHLQRLADARIERVVINLGWLGEQIAARVASGGDYGLNVIYSPEDEGILDTGGGIHRALPMLGREPFLVVNADIFTDMPMPIANIDEQTLGKLILVPTPAHKAHGDFDIVDGRLRNAEQPRLTFSGVAIYRPEFFSNCKAVRFSVVPMLRAAADVNQMAASKYSGTWVDVGTIERLETINSN